MKNIKHILVATLLVAMSIVFSRYVETEDSILVAITFLLLSFFIFNLLIRRSLSFKSYFTSKYNLFTAKFRHEQSFDISKELMFEKMVEIIDTSKFKLVEVDLEKLEILAISPITFTSWGENLYIDFETKGNQTVMNFCSTTFFQIYEWGKNEKNYVYLLDEFESSLTV